MTFKKIPSTFRDIATPDRDDDRDRQDQRLPAADPLALFHQLKPRQETVGQAADADVMAMKAAVAELRRARELARRSEELTGERDHLPARSRRRAKAWHLPAAAAALLAAVVFYGGPGVAPTQEASLPPAVAAPVALEAAAGDNASRLPLVEDLDPRQAELLQLEDDRMSLVVVLAAGRI